MHRRCIHNSWLCDGERDCSDGDDESLEVCRENKCGDREFRCGSGKCIDLVLYKCNGENDCDDESDEKNCSKYTLNFLEGFLEYLNSSKLSTT